MTRCELHPMTSHVIVLPNYTYVPCLSKLRCFKQSYLAEFCRTIECLEMLGWMASRRVNVPSAGSAKYFLVD